MTTGMTQLDPATMDEESGVSSDAVPPSKRGRSRLSILRLHTKVANTGSTARDHLANERTFLAWLRTGLSLLAVGLAFARFAHGWTAMLTGGLFVSLGAVFVAFSGWRYFQVRNDLMDDNFSINTGGVILMLGLTIAVAVGCSIVMIALLVYGSTDVIAPLR